MRQEPQGSTIPAPRFARNPTTWNPLFLDELTAWLASSDPVGLQNSELASLGPTFGIGIALGEFGRPKAQNGLSKWALCFMVFAAFLGSKGTWNLENTKILSNTQGSTQNACCSKHAFLWICFSPKESGTMQKCIFLLSKCASLILRMCFLPLAGRSKNIFLSPVAPFRIFGKLKWARGPFEDQWVLSVSLSGTMRSAISVLLQKAAFGDQMWQWCMDVLSLCVGVLSMGSVQKPACCFMIFLTEDIFHQKEPKTDMNIFYFGPSFSIQRFLTKTTLVYIKCLKYRETRRPTLYSQNGMMEIRDIQSRDCISVNSQARRHYVPQPQGYGSKK